MTSITLVLSPPGAPLFLTELNLPGSQPASQRTQLPWCTSKNKSLCSYMYLLRSALPRRGYAPGRQNAYWAVGDCLGRCRKEAIRPIQGVVANLSRVNSLDMRNLSNTTPLNSVSSFESTAKPNLVKRGRAIRLASVRSRD